MLGAAEIWREFLRELDGGKPNARLKPLFRALPGCTCVRCTVATADGELTDIVASTRTALAEGSVRQAFDSLDRVRGVGPKIAPFFLRVAVRFEIASAQDRELLQPVDSWVRRYVTRLAGDAVAGSYSRIARWICMHSVAPEAVNQGLWYFASQISASDVKLHRAFDDEAYARDLVERYVGYLRDAVTAWDRPGEDQRYDG